MVKVIVTLSLAGLYLGVAYAISFLSGSDYTQTLVALILIGFAAFQLDLWNLNSRFVEAMGRSDLNFTLDEDEPWKTHWELSGWNSQTGEVFFQYYPNEESAERNRDTLQKQGYNHIQINPPSRF